MPFSLRNSVWWRSAFVAAAQCPCYLLIEGERERELWMGLYSFMFQTVHTHTFAKSHTLLASLQWNQCSQFSSSVHSISQCHRLLVIRHHIMFCNFWYWCYHSAAFVLWCCRSFTLYSGAIKGAIFDGVAITFSFFFFFLFYGEFIIMF